MQDSNSTVILIVCDFSACKCDIVKVELSLHNFYGLFLQ